MKIAVVGINHKTAPLPVREKLFFSTEQVSQVLPQLPTRLGDAEYVLLSTCNRTELYLATRGDTIPQLNEVAEFFGESSSLNPDDFKTNLYFYQGEEAVRHLLTVTSSLDSMVIGEPQIIAQVKESYRLAVAAQSTAKIINRLFHCAFATSKEVYTLTSIAQRRVSVAGVAIDLAGQLFEDIPSARVAVIGAGQMGELLIKHLLDVGCSDITVYNRTIRRAQVLAEQLKVNTGKWDDLQSALQQVDIVVAAALTEEHLFEKSIFQGRRKGALLIIDIAVPRNFDPVVNELDEVYLYSVDDLAQVIQENLQARQEDIDQAHQIITDNVESFMDWFALSDIGPLIGKLRQKFQQISHTELERFLAGEASLPALQKQKMEAAVERIINKLLHRLIQNFHTVARNYGLQQASDLIDSIISYEDRSADSQLPLDDQMD